MKSVHIVFFLIASTSFSYCQSTFVTDGFWDVSSNWSPASVPNSTSTDVTVNNNIDPTIRSTGGPYVIGNVSTGKTTFSVNSGGSLTLGSSSLFTGGTKKSMTLNNNATLQIDGTLEIWGDLIVNNNLALNITGTMIVHGDVILNNGGSLTVSGGGKLTVGGNLTGSNNTTISTTGSGTISVAGSISITGNGSSISGAAGSITAGSCSLSGGSCPSFVLPIELLFFNSQTGDHKISLKWATASELNFDYFDIEKSGDGLNFKTISNIKGNGTSYERHDYEFEDNFPLIGKNYYRLTSVDFDNYRETFKIIVQPYSGEKEFQVSPNPTVGLSISVRLNFDGSGGYVIIYDNIGSIVSRFEMNESSGKISFLNPLKSGVYLAKYTSSSFTKTVRFVVK